MLVYNLFYHLASSCVKYFPQSPQATNNVTDHVTYIRKQELKASTPKDTHDLLNTT